ncbi:MAG: DUF1611 domain-containing protein [Proteobacteria bacterium]|nr:DUF1611 domain-containing protein [Pseudomonadota bacterium]
MKPNAIIITNGLLAQIDGKTAHGLIRGTDRFNIVGVIDHNHADQDAGEVLDGQHRNIPIYASIREFKDNSAEKAEYGIVGVALSGGRLPEEWTKILLETMENGMSIVNGLHQALGDDPMFAAAAEKCGVAIKDIRKSPAFDQLRFWNGEVYQVKTPRIAVLGMDCAIGKRTTSCLMTEMCRENGIRAEMIYTGQTGWLQGYKYGFIFDATPNDFVCGEIERAIVNCDREASPDLILIEGQSGLRNPAGPCGSEFLLSGNVKGVVLQHAPFRTYYDEQEELGCRLPTVEDEIELIKMFGATTLAVSLNGENADGEDLTAYQKKLSTKLKIPIVRPMQEGLAPMLPAIRRFMQGEL